MTPSGEYTVLDWGEKEMADRYVCSKYNGEDARKLNRIRLLHVVCCQQDLG